MVQPDPASVGLREVVSKAEEFVASNPVVVINDEALRQLMESIDPQACAKPHVGLPLKFDNDMQVRFASGTAKRRHYSTILTVAPLSLRSNHV